MRLCPAHTNPAGAYDQTSYGYAAASYCEPAQLAGFTSRSFWTLPGALPTTTQGVAAVAEPARCCVNG